MPKKKNVSKSKRTSIMQKRQQDALLKQKSNNKKPSTRTYKNGGKVKKK